MQIMNRYFHIVDDANLLNQFHRIFASSC